MRFPHSVVVAAMCGSVASAAHAAERHRLDLPAGRLGDAVVTLGNQARISIGIADAALAGERVPAIGGRLTVEQALRRLLRGKSARYVIVESGLVRLVRERPRMRKPAQMPARVAPAPLPAPAPVEHEDVIVTASRWDVPLRSFPGGVLIVRGDDPELTSGVRGTEALVSRLPSLTSTHLGPGRNKLFVRGIADSSFNGPTQATVGQYLGETRLNYNAPDPDLRLHDIERVEVLTGPQGTLYGAGSLGGIIRIVPNAPQLDRFEATASAGASLTQHGDPGADAAALVNVPVAGGEAAFRLSGYAVSEGGYIDDIQRNLDDVNRVRVVGGHLAVRSAPDAQWTIDFSATGQRIRGEDAQFAERGLGRLTRRSTLKQDFGNDYLLGSIVATKEWDDFRFVASTGLVRQKLEERYDATRAGNPPAAYDLSTDVSLLTAEARLSRQRSGGVGWLVGATVLDNRSDQRREVTVAGGATRQLRNRLENDIVEGALYGEGTVRLVPGVTATLGGRISASRLSSSGFAFQPGFPLPSSPVTASRGDTRFLPAAALAARASPDLLLYARYQESYRAGGLAIFGDEFSRFRPDKIRSYEAGLRYGVLGAGAVDAAAAVVYTRWSDIQADTLNNFAELTTANVGDARIYTLDLSAGWRPLPGLSVEAAAALNDSALTTLTLGGSSIPSPPFPGVADFNGRLAAHYAFAASDRFNLRLSAAARYTGRSNLGAGDFLRRPQGDWLDLSLSLRVDSGRQSLLLSVTNLLDTDASRFALGSPFTLDQKDHTTPVRPRTVRLGWETRF